MALRDIVINIITCKYNNFIAEKFTHFILRPLGIFAHSLDSLSKLFLGVGRYITLRV